MDNLFDNIMGNGLLGFERIGYGRTSVYQRDPVGIVLEACSFILKGIEHDQVEIFGLQLALGMFQGTIRFEGKTH